LNHPGELKSINLEKLKEETEKSRQEFRKSKDKNK
jgi:hypothetical protein